MSWARGKGWKASDFSPMKQHFKHAASSDTAAENDGAVGTEDDHDGAASCALSLENQEAAAAADALYAPLEAAASELSFAALCRCFEKVPSLPAGKHRIGSLFPPSLRTMQPRPSLYPLLRLIVPEIDAGRGMFGMKHKSLATLYVELLGLPKSSFDAQRLLHWRDPTKSAPRSAASGNGGIIGEFSGVLYEVLQHRVGNAWSSFTVGEVNTLLDQLAACPDTPARMKLFREKVFTSFSAIEQKWLVRIILRDMKLGLRHESVLKWVHEEAEPCFSACCDLRKTCYALTSPTGLAIMGQNSRLVVGQPFTPMLSKGFNGHDGKNQLSQCELAMKKNKFVMDIKLDGERMLCHKLANGSVKWFTRRANEYSHLYGPVMNDLVKSHVNVESCILDGEMVSYGASRKGGQGGLVPFGSNRTVAAYEQEAMDQAKAAGIAYEVPGTHLFYIVFDVLNVSGAGATEALQRVAQSSPTPPVVNGDVTKWPLLHRRVLLQAILDPVPKRLEFVKHKVVEEVTLTREERQKRIQDFFFTAFNEGEEGLVVKDLSSEYCIGEKSRQKAHWVKMKPEYSDQVSNLDVLIVGGYYGNGRSRAGFLSHFLLAVADHTTMPEDGSEPSDVNATKWYTTGKVGTGYTMEEVKELNAKVEPYKVPYGKAGKAAGGKAWPKWLHPWNMKADDVPDVWIPPHRSVVIEIKCAEVVDSDQFSALKTPRFPRCENLRYDKSWHEALTLKELDEVVKNMRSSSAIAPGDGPASSAGGGVGGRLGMRQLRRKLSKKGGRDRTATVMKGVVSREEALMNCPNQEPISNIFEGYSFSVEGVPELTRVKVPSPPGLQLPWSSSTKRKLLTDTLEASSLSSSSSSAAAAASQAWADSTQDDGVEPSATLTSSSSPLASAPPPLPSTPSTTTSWSETEIAAMKMERFTPVNLCDVQKLLYMHGADKVVGSSLTQVDFVITVGGDTSKKLANLKAERNKLRQRTRRLEEAATRAKGPATTAAATKPLTEEELGVLGCDVVLLAWVLDSAAMKSLALLHYEYVVDASPDTQLALNQVADEFGDRYLEPSTTSSLRRCLDRVGFKRPKELPWQQAVDHERQHKQLRLQTSSSSSPFSGGGLTPPQPLLSQSQLSQSQLSQSQLSQSQLSQPSSQPAKKRGATLLFGPVSKTTPPLRLDSSSGSNLLVTSANSSGGTQRSTNEPPFSSDTAVNGNDDIRRALPDWRDVVLSEFSREEQEVMQTKFTAFWRRDMFTVYVDRYQDLGSLEPPSSNDQNKDRAAVKLPHSALAAAEHRIRLLAGEVTPSLHYNTTHVVVDPSAPSRFQEIQARLQAIKRHPNAPSFHVRVVTAAWVKACAREGRARAPEGDLERALLVAP